MRDSTTNGLLINTKTAVHNQQWGPLDTKYQLSMEISREKENFLGASTKAALIASQRPAEHWPMRGEDPSHWPMMGLSLALVTPSLCLSTWRVWPRGGGAGAGRWGGRSSTPGAGTGWSWYYLTGNILRVSGQDPRHVTLARGTAEDDVSKKVGLDRYIMSVSRKKTPNYAPCPLRWAA